MAGYGTAAPMHIPVKWRTSGCNYGGCMGGSGRLWLGATGDGREEVYSLHCRGGTLPIKMHFHYRSQRRVLVNSEWYCCHCPSQKNNKFSPEVVICWTLNVYNRPSVRVILVKIWLITVTRPSVGSTFHCTLICNACMQSVYKTCCVACKK